MNKRHPLLRLWDGRAPIVRPIMWLAGAVMGAAKMIYLAVAIGIVGWITSMVWAFTQVREAVK